MKASKYSTTYQMHEQRGSFQGIDTCDVTNFGDFSFNSVFLDESESVSIANRPDVNSLLNRLEQSNFLCKRTVESMRKRALESSPSPEVIEKCIHGATYVTLDDCIELQKKLTVDETIDIRINDIPEETIDSLSDDNLVQHGNTDNIRVRPNWVTKIIFAQKVDKERYGAIMNVIPIYQNSGLDTRLIWITSAILTQVKELWEATCALTMCTSKWHGWLLTYLTKHCLDSFNLRRSKLTPYKNKFINTIPAIASKLGITYESIYESSDIKDIFSDHDLEKLLVTTIYDNFQQ